jgi:cell division protein FtsW
MRKLFSKMDKPLLLVVITFFIFGLVMVLSASSMESYMRYGYGPYHYFLRQSAFMVLGLILFFIIIKIPLKTYKNLSFLMTIVIIGCLIGLNVYGKISHNAQSWFKLGSISIQPSEFAKIIVIMYLANYYSKHKDELDSIKRLIIPIILVIIIFGLVLIQPDLGTALIIAGISFLMFFSLPMPKKIMRKFIRVVMIGIILILGVYVITDGKILKDYQKARFNFLDPCERYQEESGYQLCNSFIAFKNGGLTGQGIGKSTQKYLYLPESYTDFIFPIIVEEWGAWAGIFIILCYLFIIYRLYKIARNANDLHASLIAYGVCVYIFLHVSINLLGVMGLAPLTGVPLPFLSYGGSYVISLIISLALAERVAIENNNKTLKQKKRN